MPDRIIRDRCRRSPTLQQLSDAAERAWWRLTTYADDYGRFEVDAEVLLAELFTRRPAGWTLAKIRKVVSEWAEAPDPLIHLYQVDGDPRVYGHSITFQDHQRERDSKPKYPDPPCGNLPQAAAKCRDSLQSAAYSERRESGAERRESGAEVSSPPQLAASRNHTWPSPESLVALYNTETPDECPALNSLSPARREKARRYHAAFPDQDFWRKSFAEIHKSKFLRGLKPSPGHEHFIASLDWLLTKGKDGTENIVKTVEGRYRDGASK